MCYNAAMIQEDGGFQMAGNTGVKARKQKKKILYRVLTIVVVFILAGGILLASLLSRLY
jgi:hypothetical protein